MNLGTLGSLFIDLAANTATFETDIGRAAKLAQQRSREIQKAFEDAGENALAAFESYRIADKLVESIKGAIEATAQLGKEAQKLGIGTQRLSELKYAASLADVGFDQLSAGLKKFNVAGVEAANGGKEQAAAFKAVGISLADLKRLSPEQQLNRVADAFANSRDNADKTAVAVKLFGKAGADLIPFLDEGAAAIAKAGEEARVFHQVVSEQASRAADEFTTNLIRMKAVTQGLATQVAANLLPTFKDLSDQYLEYARDGDRARAVSEDIANGIKGILIAAVATKAGLSALGEAIGTDVAAAQGAFSKLSASSFLIPGKFVYDLASGIKAQGPQIDAAYKDIGAEIKANIDRINQIVLAGTSKTSSIPDQRNPTGTLHYNPQALAAADELQKRQQSALQAAQAQLSAAENEAQGHKDIAAAVALRQKVEEGEYASFSKNAKRALLDYADQIEANEVITAQTREQTKAIEEQQRKQAETAKAFIDKYGPSAQVSNRDFRTQLQGAKSFSGAGDAASDATKQENDRYAAEQQSFKNSRQAILEAGGDFDALEKAAAQAHADELTRIRKEGVDAQNAVLQKQLGVASGIFSDLAESQNQSTKSGFENYKKFAIAQATISTINGAIGAFTQAASAFPPPYGEIAGAVAAAAVTAAGLARIGQISGEQFQARRYGGAVDAGGAYSVAEPGNPELLRYGSKTLLLMGNQSGTVIPARAASAISASAAANGQMYNIINNAPAITFRPGPDGITAEMLPDVRDYIYAHTVDQVGRPSSDISQALKSTHGTSTVGNN